MTRLHWVIISAVEIVIYSLLAYFEEWFFFQAILISQIMLAIVLLSVHRQQNMETIDNFHPARSLYVIIPIAAIACLSFVLGREWLAPSTWAQASQILTHKYSEMTILVGLVMGALALLGSLALQRRRKW